MSELENITTETTITTMMTEAPAEVETQVATESKEEIFEPYSLEIDFENYTVPEKRAQHIRDQVTALKQKSWLSDAFEWVNNVGEEFDPEAAEAVATESKSSSLFSDRKAKRVSIKKLLENSSTSSESSEVSTEPVILTSEFILEGTELVLKIENRNFLVCQKLPKGDEILISHYNNEQLETFTLCEDLYQSAIKGYTKSKAEKNKLIQEKLAARLNKGT